MTPGRGNSLASVLYAIMSLEQSYHYREILQSAQFKSESVTRNVVQNRIGVRNNTCLGWLE